MATDTPKPAPLPSKLMESLKARVASAPKPALTVKYGDRCVDCGAKITQGNTCEACFKIAEEAFDKRTGRAPSNPQVPSCAHGVSLALPDCPECKIARDAAIVTVTPKIANDAASAIVPKLRERAAKIAERNRQRNAPTSPSRSCAGCNRPVGDMSGDALCLDCKNAGHVDTSIAATPAREIKGTERERLMALTNAYHFVPGDDRDRTVSAKRLAFAKEWLAGDSVVRRFMCLEID